MRLIPSRLEAAFHRRLDPASFSPLALALSGGGDSLALLALTCDWARPRGREVLALSVDHGLNPDSPAWSERAKAMAEGLGARWRGLKWTGEKPSTGLPAAARAARHALIATAAREAGASVVLFAHTLDDVAEGEAMRAEGTSLGRLAEWSPSPAWPQGRGVFLFRPLLGASREELRALLRRRGLEWIEDPANVDPRFSRARVRLSLPSPLKGEGGGEALGRGAAPVSGDGPASIFDRRAAPHPGPHGPTFPLEGGRNRGVAVDPAGVITVPRALLSGRFLSAALLCASGATRPPRGERLARLADRIASPEVFTATLCGARIEARTDEIAVMRDAGETARGGLAPVALNPGTVAIWDGRFEIEADEAGEILALKGHAAGLPGPERLEISGFAPAARAALPIFRRNASLSPHLASVVLRVRCLVGPRLEAACGVITHEGEIANASRGAEAKASLCCTETAPPWADSSRSE